MAAGLSAKSQALVKMLQPCFKISALHLVRRKISDPGLLAPHPEVEEPVAVRPSGFVCVFAAVLLDLGEEQFDQIAHRQLLALAVLLTLR